MNRDEAYNEAVRRWRVGWAKEVNGRFFVGIETNPNDPDGYCVWGRGDSWESAFADADAREARK